MPTVTVNNANADGSSDMTATIQTAVTAALALPSSPNTIRGGVVVLPSGNYNLNAISIPTPPGGRLIVRGEANVTITPRSSVKIFDLTGCQDVTFENITFDLANSSGVGIYGDNCSSITVRGCRFTNCISGAYFRSVTSLRFEDNVVDNSPLGGWGFYLGACSNGWVVRNHAYSNGIDGLKFGPATTAGSGTITLASSPGSAQTVTGTGTSFTTEAAGSDRFLLVYDGSAYWWARILSVSSNTSMVIDEWLHAFTSATSYYIGTWADLKDVVIAENECYSNGGAGINIDSSALHNVIVANNTVRDNTGYGINCKMTYKSSEYRRVLFSDNVLSNNTGGGLTVQRNDSQYEAASGTASLATTGVVTGSGTTFTQQMMRGRSARVGDLGGPYDIGLVTKIDSDTSMTIGLTGSSQSVKAIRYLPEIRGLAIMGNVFEMMNSLADGIRLSGVVAALVAGNQVISNVVGSSGYACALRIINCADVKVRGNQFDTDSHCILFDVQESSQYNIHNVVEHNFLTSRVGSAVRFMVQSGLNIDNRKGNVVHHNQVTLLTGSSQWTVVEDSTITTEPTVRYMNERGSTSSSPTGDGTQGDIFWNRDPGNGESLGWVCVAGGSPGTWVPFGEIARVAQLAINPSASVTSLSIGLANYIRLTGTAYAVTILGIADGYDGRRLTIQNNTAQTVTFAFNDAGAASAERIWNKAIAAVSIANGGAASFIYDANNNKWIMVAQG